MMSVKYLVEKGSKLSEEIFLRSATSGVYEDISSFFSTLLLEVRRYIVAVGLRGIMPAHNETGRELRPCRYV